jgi:alanyl-tRNA synthetase
MVSKDLTATYHAGTIIKEMAAILGGTGGGKPDLAQAGGKDPAKLDAALDAVFRIIEKTTK